ncbi:MAG: DNA damage-inducible protein D [Bacilli bacterium]|nr:DNA damage-inducible protein D [Bacilli bacterium]
MNEIKEYTETVFEDIKHIDELGNEYWYARELMPLLEYIKWENFDNVIQKAVISYKNSNNDDSYWLPEVRKPIITGKGKEEFIKDYKLSRYICYLIVQNANPKKKMVALGQTYFAIQTRKQELSELEYNNLTEDEKRLYRRNQARKGNFNLNKTAVNSGVKDLARFHNAGYKGLYNGETADDIFKRKKLRYREDILDNMGSEELADNIFRIAQTDAKLKRDNVDNEYTANSVHYEIGKIVRKAIKEAGGTMPEDLTTPERSLKEIEKGRKHDIINIGCGNMKQEILDLYDNNFNRLNKTIIRRVDEIPNGTNIMQSYILIKNEDKYLLEQTTERNNYKWAIPGGHVLTGETPEVTLKRELEEELGIRDIKYKKVDTIKFPYNNYIFNVFYSNTIVDINLLKLQPDEVIKVKWYTKEEILELIENDMIPRGYAYILKNYMK